MDLSFFEKLLGDDVFFVPCEWGTKKPLVTYAERPFEATKTEAYRAVFNVQEVNVAVYLGRSSGGLFIHERCARLVEYLPSLQHDPNRLKMF